MLAGQRDPTIVTDLRRVENVASNPRDRYELDAGEQATAMREMEARGESVVGFYHSHPRGPPEPSATDARLAAWPGYCYCVVSLPDESVTAWRWTGEAFEPVPVTSD